MSLKERLEADLKTALLSGDKALASTLRLLKSAILYVEVAKNKRDTGLNDEEIIEVLAKEAKKRQESADLYIQGGNQERAAAEQQEKKIIEKYLPQQLSSDEIIAIINEVSAELGGINPQTMGRVIGEVKQRAGASADGGEIARLVKEKL